MSIFNWTAPIFKLAGHRWSSDDFRVLAEHLRPFVPPGGVFLDLGGGTGELGTGLAQALQARVVIVDPTPQMLRRADAHPLVTQRLASAESLPFPDSYFDGLVCSDAFHHVRDQTAAAKEIARVVRPGGGALFLEFEPTKTLTWLERLVREPAHFRTSQELQQFLASHGIRGECIPVGATTYLCVGTVGPSEPPDTIPDLERPRDWIRPSP